MNKTLITIIIIILVGGIGWYLVATYNTDDITAENANTAMIDNNNSTTQKSPVNGDGNQGVVDYAISMTEYSYSPSEIMVEGPNETIKLKLTNDGNMVHDFVIDELNVNSGLIQPGDSKIISITSGEIASTFNFYCSVGNHRGLGMFGTFKQ